MNLVLGEFLISVFGIPVDFVASAQHGWKMGKEFCIATGFILTLLGMSYKYLPRNALSIVSMSMYVFVLGMNSLLSLTGIAIFRLIVLTKQVIEY